MSSKYEMGAQSRQDWCISNTFSVSVEVFTNYSDRKIVFVRFVQFFTIFSYYPI